MSFWFHDCGFVPSALWTEPLSLWLPLQQHTAKVEPLDGAQVVVAANHLAVGDLVAQAVSRLVRINLYIGQLAGSPGVSLMGGEQGASSISPPPI